MSLFSLLSREQASGILEKIKYKNAKISLHSTNLPFIYIELPVKCVKTGADSVLNFAEIADMRGEQQLLRSAMRAVILCEKHEAQEHFLYGGERIFDPHQKGGEGF